MTSGIQTDRPLSRPFSFRRRLVCVAALAAGAALAGCSGRASILPNPDPALRKTSTQFAADAAKCFPYKPDAPRGGDAAARAEVDYNLRAIHLTNLSGEEWHNVEVWVDGKYVVAILRVPKSTAAKPSYENLNFQLIFDDKGNHYPTFGTHIKKIEIYRDGKMYDVALHLAD